MDAVTYPHADVRKLVAEKFVAVKIDVGAPENEAAAARYEIGPIPDTVFALPDGTAVHRFVGFAPPKAFLQEMKTALAAKDQWDAAQKRLKEKPDDAEARLDLGTLLVRWKEFDKAKAHFEAAVAALDGGTSDLLARGLYQLALTRLRLGEGPAAEKQFERLAALGTPAAKELTEEAALDRGVVTFDLGSEKTDADPEAGRKLLEEARARLETFLRDHAGSGRAAEARYYRAHALLKSGEVGNDDALKEKAKAAFKEVVEKHPGTPWAEEAKKALEE